MAKIIPTNELYILQGVPFSKNDNKTLSTKAFGSIVRQASFFMSKSIHHSTAFTYIYETGAISLDINSMEIINANYIMYKNSDYSNKWIYAFIDKVVYTSPSSCDLYFTIDNIQTFLFNFNFKECFVEREHVIDDSIGSNLITDSFIETGMLYTDLFQWTGVSNTLYVVLVTTFKEDGTDAEGKVYGGIYSACEYIAYNMNSQSQMDELNQFIQSAVTNDLVDGIVDLFIMPGAFFTDENVPVVQELTFTKRYGDFQGYTPQNNKAYTYPYNYLIAQSTSGQQQELMFEKFLGSDCKFIAFGSNYSNAQIILAPRGYNADSSLTNSTDLSYMITLEGFPHCAFNVDTFKAYIAQNGGSMAIQALTSAVMAGASAVSGNPLTAFGAIQGASNVLTTANEMAVRANKPPEMRGSTTVSALAAYKLLDFSIRNVRMTSEYCRKADKIWNMFGYPVNTVKTPNITSRPRYNYVKTQNSIVTGNCPPDALSEIMGNLNRGYTFWHGDYVGDYSTLNK